MKTNKMFYSDGETVKFVLKVTKRRKEKKSRSQPLRIANKENEIII